MSLNAALKSFTALDEAQKRLLEQKRLEGTRTPGEWFAFFKNVVEYDRNADALRKVVGWSIFIALVLGIIVGFIAGPLLFIVFLMVVGLFSVGYFMLKKNDLPDNLGKFVLPVLALLREEMEPDAELFLRLDLNGGTHKDKKLNNRNLQGRGGAQVAETLYRDGWMELRANLVDGSVLAWQVIDHIRERTVTKRNARGKTKVKTKYKVKRLLDARVGLRSDEYQIATAAAAGKDLKIGVKEGEKRNVMRLRKVLGYSQPNADLDPRLFLDMLAGAYGRVSLTNTEGR